MTTKLLRTILIVSVFGVTQALLPAELTGGQQRTWLQGYARTVKGGTIDYSSFQSDVNKALIVRSIDSADTIEWETEAVPSRLSEDVATFVWVFGINANLEVRDFFLSINDQPLLTFKRPINAARKEWTVKGDNGVQLQFRVALVDQHRDLFGYAFLKVPVSLLVKGKPLRIKVHGESAASRVWYMTFQHVLSDTLVIVPQEALLREGKNGLQPVAVEMVYLGDGGRVRLRAAPNVELNSHLSFGFNRFVLKFPEVKTEQTVHLEITLNDDKATVHSFVQKPIRQWTVYLVQHAHTDIGYTRPQTEILPEHLRFIDYALDYCDLTDQYPDDAKFRWTCEASWPVREYLKSRPASQIERLRKRVREGRIEVTGMMFNMTELPDENLYAAFLQPVRAFKEAGIPVVSAMQDDVNGAAWCLVDFFHDIGIKYLTMGQNASRALKPFDIPTPFWWESPSGNRTLVFRADHYMTGNFLTLEQGKLDRFEPELFGYLRNLEQKSYQYDRIAVQYSGYFTDNSAPSTPACDVIREWNAKYFWPRLRNATVHEFPEYMEKEHAGQLPTFRAAWPDWWTDGVGSAARETAAARRTQAEMIANQGLFSMSRLLGIALPDEVFVKTEAIQDALLFYDEHTFGAAESITDPRAENSMVQWAEKSAYVWDAVKNTRMLREAALGLLQNHLVNANVPTITVFNTLGWSRSGLLPAYIDNQILPPDRKCRIVDPNGNVAAAQLESRRADGSYWGVWVDDIPAMGYKTYRIEVEPDSAAPSNRRGAPPGVLENRFYRIVLDPGKGAIRSIFDKESGRELVDTTGGWEAGQFVYETLGNREQLEQLRLSSYKRTTLGNVRIREGTDGEIWKSILIAGQTEACAGQEGVTVEIRLYNKTKKIELRFTARKLPITTPEAVYVAFPFSLPASRIVYDAQGGAVTPGIDQIPGSSSDWQTIQNFASARNAQGQILLVSDEIPLFQFGDINLGKFQRIARVDKPYMFSWVLNNYWGTNFVASQEGELKWNYNLTSTGDTSTTYSTHFGWEGRIPLVSRVLPAGAGNGKLASESLWNVRAPGVLLVSTMPTRDGSGIVAQLRELEGRSADLSIPTPMGVLVSPSLLKVNVLGEKLAEENEKVHFNPYEVQFLKIYKK